MTRIQAISEYNFVGVKQPLKSVDCIPASIATVLKSTIGSTPSLGEIKNEIRMRKDGSFLSEAGIYLQDRGFETHYELWKWQTFFPVLTENASPEEIQRFLERVSNGNGMYKEENYLPYVESGGRLTLGGSIHGLLKKQEQGDSNIFALISLDDYKLHRVNTRKKIRHVITALMPHLPEESQRVPSFHAYCPTIDRKTPFFYPDGYRTISDAIMSSPKGAVLYVKQK